MKYLPLAAILILAAGCGSSGGTDDSSNRGGQPGDSREAERTQIRSKINAKKQELSQTDSDIAKVRTEREQLMSQPASDTKTNRLVELARLSSDLDLKRSSLTEDIAQLQAQIGEGSGSVAAKPAKSADPLDELLATNETKEKEEAERRKKKAEDEAAGDKARIAQAEAARKAELDERAKQKIEGGRIAQGPDAPAFEDRWADVIQKIRGELQRYKRW
jgi:chromosome segregation ATPase